VIHKAPDSLYSRVAPIFGGRKQYVPVHAVLQGNFPGLVWVDDLQHPRTALVWALTRWAYLAGDPRSRRFLAGLEGFVADVVRPLADAMHQRWFELYAHPSPQWEVAVEAALMGMGAYRHYETTSKLDRVAFESSSAGARVPTGMVLRRVEFPVVSEAVAKLPFVPDGPAGRLAPGFELLQGGRAVSVCRSNGLRADEQLMLDVATASPRDRHKGFAAVVSRAMIAHALAQGLEPLWETTEDNTASRRLADRLGYQEQERYPVYAVELKSATGAAHGGP
jgi:hypothetical protein